jgi:hypothetical protein
MENENKPDLTPSQLLMILACVAVAFLERRTQMKTAILLLVCVIALSGCSHTDRQEFEVWVKGGRTIPADRVYVSPGGFAIFGKTITVPTTEGIAYVEKDLSNIKSIFFLSEKAKEIIDDSKKSLNERIEAERARRAREKEPTAPPNLILSYLDGRSVPGLYDLTGVDLVCITADTRIDIPLTSIVNIEHRTESSGDSGAGVTVVAGFCLLVLGIVLYVWFQGKRSSYVRHTKRTTRGNLVSPSRSAAAGSSNNRNRASRTRPLENDSEVGRDGILGVCVVVRHGSRSDAVDTERDT